MTKGEKLVVGVYTPLSDAQRDKVKSVKDEFIALIDKVEAEDGDGRWKSIVVSNLETAAMYYIKLITNPNV